MKKNKKKLKKPRLTATEKREVKRARLVLLGGVVIIIVTLVPALFLLNYFLG